jgi:hypothetical protein
MAKFEICFKQVRTYYDYEVVEAASQEEAGKLAAALVDSEDFQMRIDDEASYEGAEYYVNGGHCAWETTSAVTLSERDINEYLNEEE